MTQTQPYQINSTRWYSGYTFSAKEKDEESGYNYFGARYFDSDLSVWLSVDPLSNEYPEFSPFMYCFGNPLTMVDPDGNFAVSQGFKNKYPNFYKYLTTNFVDDVMKNEKLVNELMTLGEFKSIDELKNVLKSVTIQNGGIGPLLDASLHPGSSADGLLGLNALTYFAGGYTNPENGNIEISTVLLDQFEELYKAGNIIESATSLLGLFETIVHETTHSGDVSHNGETKPLLNEDDLYGNNSIDLGNILVGRVWGSQNTDNNLKEPSDLRVSKQQLSRKHENFINNSPSIKPKDKGKYFPCLP